jgi:hypothetical protein
LQQIYIIGKVDSTVDSKIGSSLSVKGPAIAVHAICQKIFMAIFEFFGQFFFQNDVFKLQEDFSEHGIRVCLENELGHFLTLVFVKYLVVSFRSISSVFGRFIEDYLKNLTCWEKSINRFGLYAHLARKKDKIALGSEISRTNVFFSFCI